MRHDHYVLIILQIEGHPDLISWIIEEPEEPIGQLGARWIDADPLTVGHHPPREMSQLETDWNTSQRTQALRAIPHRILVFRTPAWCSASVFCIPFAASTAWLT